MTRAASWVVEVAIPKLMPDRLTAPLRQRMRKADDRLERAARRLTGRQVNPSPKNLDRHTQ